LEPLALLSYYEQKGLMKPSMVRLVRKRLKYVEEGVRRVEEASSLNYPKYYIEPRLHLCSDGSVTSLGVFYARMIPMEFEDRIEPMVELSAALIALGSKYTIHAVLAHEFLHYVEFAMKLKNFSITSDAPVYSNFEAVYVDEEKLVDPKKVFRSRSLLNLLKKKFRNGLVDERLNSKVVRLWIDKGLPTVSTGIEYNFVRIPVEKLAKVHIDPVLLERLDELGRDR